MKHLFRTIAIVFALCLFCGNANAQKVVLNSGNLNLRYGPSLNAGILSDYYGNHIHYAKGTTFNYAGETRNGFYCIYVNGERLWVAAQYARLVGGGNQYSSGSSTKRHVVINGTNVNFRLGPSLNSATLTDGYGNNVHVPKYTRLPYLGASGNFFKTRYNGRTVYVSMQFAYTE